MEAMNLGGYDGNHLNVTYMKSQKNNTFKPDLPVVPAIFEVVFL